MPANLENSAVAIGLETSVFIPVPKKGNAKECSDNHTVMVTYSSVLAWRIPGTGEPGRLPYMGSHRVRHD